MGRDPSKGEQPISRLIDSAVFPGLQGGPHNHAIAAVAAAMHAAAQPDFEAYARAVVANAQALAARLAGTHGYTLVTGGTDNHCVLLDLRPQALTGSKFEACCDRVQITVNKNSVPGDRSALTPGGARLGSPALTARGFGTAEMELTADFLHRAAQIALRIQARTGKKLKDFKAALGDESDAEAGALAALHAEVRALATQFALPGL